MAAGDLREKLPPLRAAPAPGTHQQDLQHLRLLAEPEALLGVHSLDGTGDLLDTVHQGELVLQFLRPEREKHRLNCLESWERSTGEGFFGAGAGHSGQSTQGTLRKRPSVSARGGTQPSLLLPLCPTPLPLFCRRGRAPGCWPGCISPRRPAVLPWAHAVQSCHR